MNCKDCPEPEPAAIPNQIYALRALLPNPFPETDFSKPTFHPDGSIEFVQKPGNLEYPVIAGFVADARNRWLLRPIWPACQKRMYGLRVRPCGCLTITGYCKHPESNQCNGQVTADVCAGCPLAGQRVT